MVLEEKEIDIQGAVQVLRHLDEKEIISVIHPADALLIFKFGSLIGKEDGRNIYRYSLFIWGKWIFCKDRLLLNSWPISSEDKGFFMRMEDFADNFAAHQIINIAINDDGQGVTLLFNDRSNLTMWPGGAGFFNYYEYLQDRLEESTESIGIRTDEVSQKLMFFRADNRRPKK